MNPLGVQVAIDDRNIAGVTGTTAACVRVVAFMAWMGNSQIGNQALPPLPAGSCG